MFVGASVCDLVPQADPYCVCRGVQAGVVPRQMLRLQLKARDHLQAQPQRQRHRLL